jgi:hypothetical protein
VTTTAKTVYIDWRKGKKKLLFMNAREFLSMDKMALNCTINLKFHIRTNIFLGNVPHLPPEFGQACLACHNSLTLK